jgi:SpoVK/Ycf46/Vps4 family AAA+-type ATPase
MEDIEVLIKSHTPLVAVETAEEERLEQLIQEIAWRLNLPLYVWDCSTGLCRCGQDSKYYKSQDVSVALCSITQINNGIFFFKDLEHYLEDPRVQRILKENAENGSNKCIIFLSSKSEYPLQLEEILVSYKMPLPNKEELKRILNRFLSTMPNVKLLLSDDELNRFLNSLRGLTTIEAKRAINEAIIYDNKLDINDIKTVEELKKKMIEKERLVEYTSPEENFNTIGGFLNLKGWINKRKIAFSKNKYNLPAPKGILLIGVPGCGKTLSARAIANELGLGLIKFNPANLYSKYIGESEANMLKVIKLSESLAPIVILIDEVEKVLTTNSSESDGGLSTRLFGTFLSWLQDKDDSIFVVATSNNISALPPEFSRQGRFDEIFFVDLPQLNERKSIFEIQLIKRNIVINTIDIESLARQTEGFSGAEIEQLILSALYNIASGSGNVSTDIISAQINKTIPLSKRDPERIDTLRQWAKTHCIEA